MLVLCLYKVCFKEGGSVVNVYRCRTASCDPSVCVCARARVLSEGVETSEAGSSQQQEEKFAVEASSFAPR